MKLGEKKVRLETVDWNKAYWADIHSGKGFEITDIAIKKNAKESEKNKYGTHSPLFGTDWGDENAFEDRYRCECGDIIGKTFEGEICPKCKSKVKFKDIDVSITGWIVLHGDYSVIHPIYYGMLASVIGKKDFPYIIKYNRNMVGSGQLEYIDSSIPFFGIGLIEFKERFDEILDYYAKKKKKKLDYIEKLRADKEKVFVNAIPVYSSILRPISFRGDHFFFTDVDKKYNSIVTLSKLLNEENYFLEKRKKWKIEKRERMTIPYIMSVIQTKIMDIYDLIFEQINGKEGYIRSELLGGMINFSARNVIIPDPYLRSNEIELGYACFLELYRYEIIASLVKIHNITENEAYEQWYKARIKYSEKIYNVMNYIIKKFKPWCIINRNPTINYGSILCCKVKRVKNQYEEDYTMSLPLQILVTTNADFDGDVLNIVSLKSKDIEKAYKEAFNPRDNLYVSRNDGLFNPDMNLFKDQIIGLWQFNNI